MTKRLSPFEPARPDLFKPCEVLTVDELFALNDDDYRDYLLIQIDGDLFGPLWSELLDRQVIKRTKKIVGQIHQHLLREADGHRRVLTDEAYNKWRRATLYKERVGLLDDLMELIKARQRELHIEHQTAQQRPEAKTFENTTAKQVLRRVIRAVQWHREDVVKAGLEPTDEDLKLWRVLAITVLPAGTDKWIKLDDLWPLGPDSDDATEESK